jgi:Outer membrane protein (OmpH-like).
MFLKKQEDAQESILSDIKAVVGQIAKAEKIDAVFDKEVMLYGGEDITYKVLDQLNKKSKRGEFGTGEAVLCHRSIADRLKLLIVWLSAVVF